jgi:hypothetical protein
MQSTSPQVQYQQRRAKMTPAQRAAEDKKMRELGDSMSGGYSKPEGAKAFRRLQDVSSEVHAQSGPKPAAQTKTGTVSPPRNAAAKAAEQGFTNRRKLAQNRQLEAANPDKRPLNPNTMPAVKPAPSRQRVGKDYEAGKKAEQGFKTRAKLAQNRQLTSASQHSVTGDPAEHASLHGNFNIEHPRVPGGRHGGGEFRKK